MVEKFLFLLAVNQCKIHYDYLDTYNLTEEQWNDMPLKDKFAFELSEYTTPAEEAVENSIRFVELYAESYGYTEEEKNDIIDNLTKALDVFRCPF